MTRNLRESEPLESGLRRVAIECVDVALASLDSGTGHDEVIHTVRKQCKQLRALLRLVHKCFGPERKRESRLLRDLNRSLAELRDSKVALDRHAELIECYRTVLDVSVGAEVRQALIAAQQSVIARQQASGVAPGDPDALRQSLLAVRSRVRRWQLSQPAGDVLGAGIVRTYRKARRALRSARASCAMDDLHEARKRAKDYWYQLEFIARRWPELALERTAQSRRLTDLLGDAHDLIVYRDAIRDAARLKHPRAVELLAAVADSRRRELESAALAVGAQVFDDKPGKFAARLHTAVSAGHRAG